MLTPEFRTQSTHYHHRDNTTEKVIANTTASGKISEGRSVAPRKVKKDCCLSYRATEKNEETNECYQTKQPN